MSCFSLFNQRLCVLVFIQQVVQRFLSELQFLLRQNVEKDKSEKTMWNPQKEKKRTFHGCLTHKQFNGQETKKKKQTDSGAFVVFS